MPNLSLQEQVYETLIFVLLFPLLLSSGCRRWARLLLFLRFFIMMGVFGVIFGGLLDRGQMRFVDLMLCCTGGRRA